MTDRERAFAALGLEYAEGIDQAVRVTVPSTGREIRRVDRGWEAQPWNDNYYRIFADLLDAIRFATPPALGGVKHPSQFASERALPIRPV
jgi:hypothetical protein